jgi:hypothetical protein
MDFPDRSGLREGFRIRAANVSAMPIWSDHSRDYFGGLLSTEGRERSNRSPRPLRRNEPWRSTSRSHTRRLGPRVVQSARYDLSNFTWASGAVKCQAALTVFVATVVPGGNFRSQHSFVGDASIETLTLQDDARDRNPEDPPGCAPLHHSD